MQTLIEKIDQAISQVTSWKIRKSEPGIPNTIVRVPPVSISDENIDLDDLNSIYHKKGWHLEIEENDKSERCIFISPIVREIKWHNIKVKDVDNTHYESFRIYLARNYLFRLSGIVGPSRGMGKSMTHVALGSVCRIGHDFGVSPEAYWPYLLDWGLCCDPPFTESDLRYEYDTFLKSVKYPPGTKLNDPEYDREKQYKNWQRAQGFDGE